MEKIKIKTIIKIIDTFLIEKLQETIFTENNHYDFKYIRNEHISLIDPKGEEFFSFNMNFLRKVGL